MQHVAPACVAAYPGNKELLQAAVQMGSPLSTGFSGSMTVASRRLPQSLMHLDAAADAAANVQHTMFTNGRCPLQAWGLCCRSC